MVVLGQWPYQHTISFNQLREQAGAVAYYFVDEDRCISRARAAELQTDGFIMDDKYLTVMGEDIHTHVSAYSNQDFPPPIHPSVIAFMRNNDNPLFREMIDRVKNSSAVLVVNDQNKDIMEDIGASYNSTIGFWIIDSVALRILREKRKSKTDGKVQMKQEKDGISFVEVTGDVTPHVKLLKEVGGRYDEDKDVWYVPIGSIHKIMHITM